MDDILKNADRAEDLAGTFATRISRLEAQVTEREDKLLAEAERFRKLAAEYAKAPEVTRERLLLETLEEILPKVDKIVVDEEAGVLHLNRLDLGGDR